MKYFYYISEAKVEMLQAQLHKSQFSMSSLSSKLGIGAASVSVSAARRDRSLVSDTTKLIVVPGTG